MQKIFPSPMQAIFFNFENNSLELHVIIQPRAARDEVVGLYNERLKIRLKAAPVDGEANQYLIHTLSKLFKQPKKTISISKGLSNRRKTVVIKDLLEIPPLLLNY